MKRRVLHALLAASAALCVWSVYAWVRSYWPDDLTLRSHQGRLVVLATSGGFSKYNVEGAAGYRSASQVWAEFHRIAQSQWQAVGFAYAAADFPSGAYRLFAIPYPLVALVTAAAPAWWFRRARLLRRRGREGRCAQCGYDLRETKDRCPECGAASTNPPA